MSKNKHLTLSERIKIEQNLNKSLSFKAIGKDINKCCTIRGKGSACLLVLAERMSKETIIFKIPSQTQKEVLKRINRLEKQIFCSFL